MKWNKRLEVTSKKNNEVNEKINEIKNRRNFNEYDKFHQFDFEIPEVENEISEFEKINEKLKEMIDTTSLGEAEINQVVKKILNMEEKEIEKIMKFLELQSNEMTDEIKKNNSLKILRVINQFRNEKFPIESVKEVEEIDFYKSSNNQNVQNNDGQNKEILNETLDIENSKKFESLEEKMNRLKKKLEALDDYEQKIPEKEEQEKEDRKALEEKENDDIRKKCEEIYSLIFNSTVIIRDNAVLYSSIFDLYSNENPSVPVYDSSTERTVLGVCFDMHGNIVYCDRNYNDIKERIYNSVINGNELISIVTSIDGENFEGAYKISDLKEIKPCENNLENNNKIM